MNSTDRATIVIDCESKTVTLFEDRPDTFTMPKFPIETNRAMLIAQIVAPQFNKLMKMTTKQLMAKHLELLKESV